MRSETWRAPVGLGGGEVEVRAHASGAMMMMTKQWVVALVLLVGCHRDNPLFCAGQPNDECPAGDGSNAGSDAGSDGGVTSCGSDGDCTAAGLNVCDLATQPPTCVECTQGNATACMDTTPTCGDDNRCRACRIDDDCASLACDFPTGKCIDAADVLYVDATKSGSDCSFANPCQTIGTALGKVTATVQTIKVIAGGTYIEHLTIVKSVSIHADGVTVKPNNNDNGIDLTGKAVAQATVFGLTLDGLGTGTTGVNCAPGVGSTPALALFGVTVVNWSQDGIDTQNCRLTFDRMKILNNVGGGLSVSGGTYALTNNIIANNGDTGSTLGGVQIGNNATGTLEFNTIAANTVQSGLDAGVDVQDLMPRVFANNIVFDNRPGAGGGQVCTVGCTWNFSDIQDGVTGGSGNITDDPMFADEGNNNFHIKPGSPASGAADPAATLDHDFDNEPRPQPSGSARDIGADEIP